MKPILLCLIAFLVTFQLQSQVPQKIGHADWQFIFSQLPEYRQIEEELKSFDTQLKTQLKQKGMELEAKYKEYKALPVTTLETIKKDKESELTYLQQNLQKFTEDAQVSFQKKQAELVTPVFDKVGNAIKDVATENGFAYILNPQTTEGADILLFADNKYDISNLVLKKLGVVVTAMKTSP
jgi:outer membrane protein